VPAPHRVLDVGCGTGYLLRRLAARAPGAAQLVGVDAAAEMVRVAQAATADPRARFLEGTAGHLPGPDGAFDLAEVAPVWARARGTEAGSLAALAQNPAVLAEIEAAVAAANQQLARVQQVKRWRLLPVEWTAESEELTPTLKLKRRVVHAKYSDDIDTLYAG